MKQKIDVSKVLIENSEEEFLTVQKSDSYDWKAGKWELPGGKIDDGEDRFEAGRREVQDECGIEVFDLQDVVRVELEEFSEEKPVVNCRILHTKSFSGEIELSGEHQEFRWVSGDEFMDMEWHRDAGYEIPAMKYLEEYIS